MPRQLPWKVGSATAPKPPRTKTTAAAASPAPSWSSSATPARSRSPAQPPHARRTPKSELTSSTPGPSSSSRLSRRSLGGRSPSTSPPPEPLREEFMIAGVDHDDRYRMVEDEFLSVAGDFTRHLHAAEYKRLRGIAKSQNAETIQNISRPVTGEMTDLVRRRNAAVDAAAKQRRAVAQTVGNGGEKGGLRRQPTSLQGLMESPKKEPVLLTAVMGPRPGSGYREGSPSRRRKGALEARSGKGLDRRTQEPERAGRPNRDLSTESDTDSDDLDGQPPWPSRLNSHRIAQQSTKQVPQQPAAPGFMSRTESVPTPRNPPLDSAAPPKRALTDTPVTTKRRDNPNDDEDDFFSRMRARRAEQKRRRETKTHESTIKTSASQTAALNSIPFMQ